MTRTTRLRRDEKQMAKHHLEDLRRGTSKHLSAPQKDQMAVGEEGLASRDVARRILDKSILWSLPPTSDLASQLDHLLCIGGVLADVADHLTISREC